MTNDPTGRVLQLLSLLQTHRLWQGSALAERLDVTERTLRRDIDRLRTLGYPVDAVPGRDGGYRLAAGQHLPPLLFDDDEAVALAVGLQAAAGEAIEGIEETAIRALSKLDQVLPDRLRRRIRAITSNLSTVAWAEEGESRIDVDVLALLGQACRDSEEVRFAYRRRDGEISDRLVQPHHLVSITRRWYLLGFDVRRDDWRTFRLDRLSDLRLAGARFALRPIPGSDPAAFVSRSLGSIPQPHEATVTFHVPSETIGSAMPWLVDELEIVDADTCRLRVRAETEEQLAFRVVAAARHAPISVDASASVSSMVREIGARLTSV